MTRSDDGSAGHIGYPRREITAPGREQTTSVAAADATAAADAMDTATVSDDRATADAVVACDHNDHDSGGDQTTLYHDGE